MATNLYINNFGASAEQELLDELHKEVIQFYGVECIYVPRTLVNEDLLLGEDTASKFSAGYSLEMLIETTDAFGGEGDLITKFGFEIRDEITFAVSKTAFEVATGKTFPNEGDLIYFPLSNGLFEIKFTDHENPFYQAGKLYQFKITCQLFEYSHETIDTGVAAIDKVEDESGYAIDLTVGAGSGTYNANESVYQGASLAAATAKATAVSWNETTKVLRINNIVGTFTANVNVVGDSSAASYSLGSKETLVTDVFASNKTIETEADNVLDFSESNPFGDV